MRAFLLQLVAATAMAKSIMRTITIHKTARSSARSPINQPSKNDKYLVTANTTRLVVLKVPHSGSTWFAALLNRFPRSYVKEESIDKKRTKKVNPSAIREHVGTSLIRPTDKMVASRNGKHAFSPRAKNFDCGGCELALLGLTMCPMRSEPPYDFPQGVTAAIFHQTVKFRTIFWARTNVVKMSFASNGSKNRTKAFVKENPSCHTFARNLGYKIAQLRSLDALYDERRKVDPALVLKVRYESMQLDEAGTLATVARFLGVEAPRRFLKSSTAVGEKRASDDLRDVVKNYDEIHKWLAPKGVLASPCLLKMLAVRGPQVFEPCPAPALVARTVTSLSPAKTCPGPRGGGTSGDPLSHQRTRRHDGRRAYF